MNKNRKTKTGLSLCALLLAVITLCFSACKTPDTPVSEDSSSGTVGEADSLTLFDSENTVSVVYNFDSTSKELRTVLSNAMKKAYGKAPIFITDEKQPADSGRVEILLGNTNRPESAYAPETGKTDAWFFVGIVGQKLVINACNDYMLEKAVLYFTEEFLPMNRQEAIVFEKSDNHTYVIEDFATPTWKLYSLPYYKGATVSMSSAVYDAGTLITEKNSGDQSSCEMAIVNRTNADEFEAYISRLESYDFKEVSRNTVEDNIYVTLTRGEERVYTYFVSNLKKVQVILENGGASPEEISTPMTAENGKGAVMYQYGLNMLGGAEPAVITNNYKDNGQLNIIRCADNSLIIVDGGEKQSYVAPAGDEVSPYDRLNTFLHEITGTPVGEKVTIACWFLTHGHGDHVGAFTAFLQDYQDQYDLRSICANIPFALEGKVTMASTLGKFGSFVKQAYPDCKEVKLHTGQRLQFADVTMDILYTHEDAVSPAGISKFMTSDFNGTSTVAKFSADGISMLILGDSTGVSESAIMQMYSPETLKCDILQIAHHGFNDLPTLYEAAEAKYAFVPQSYKYFTDPSYKSVHASGMRAVKASLIKLFDNDKIFFSGNATYTVGLAYRDGKITVVHAPDTQHGLS